MLFCIDGFWVFYVDWLWVMESMKRFCVGTKVLYKVFVNWKIWMEEGWQGVFKGFLWLSVPVVVSSSLRLAMCYF